MSENLEETVRELSEIYDTDSDDTYVSLYFSQGLDTKFLERRKKAIRSLLKGDIRDNFNKSIQKIESELKGKNDESIAIFASNKNNFLKSIVLPVKVENTLIVDSSPYLRPLARMLDEWESFSLVLLNSNSAKIYSVSFGEITDSKKLSSDIMNKHKKGGCSQARFNRLRRGAIHSFFTELVEELEERADDQIIIAGPGTSKNKFAEMLPQALKEKVIDIIDIDIGDENKLLKESVHLISEKEQRESSEAVKHLKQEILKDGLAVYGPMETMKAVRNGQVELLIIEKGYKLPGWICESCQVVREGNMDKCPYCNNDTSKVDVIEEILEFAERTDAEIEFTDDEEIKELGHVGGILRYK